MARSRTLKRFIDLAETASVIFIDDGPALTSWNVDADRLTLFSAMYVDEVGVGYEYALTEDEISGGVFEQGCFTCRDSGGCEVRIRFFRLENMLEGE